MNSTHTVYKIKKSDLNKCWKFAIGYWLDESKSIIDRTNNQKRGLGGVVDSFLNKVIEIAVCGLLHDIKKTKTCENDFELHPLKDRKTEPDITNIIEKGKPRAPKIYVEIKSESSNDNWLGPKTSEVESIMKKAKKGKNENKAYLIHKGDKKKVYYVWCEIKGQTTNSRESNMLGCYLKTLVKGDKLLQKFLDYDKLHVNVKFVHSLKDIKDNGTVFPKGEMMPDTDVFEVKKGRSLKSIRKKISKKVFTKVKTSGNKLPKMTSKKYAKKKRWLPYPNALGDFVFTGDLVIYEHRSKTTRNFFIDCLTDVAIKNKVLGVRKFNEGDIVNYRVRPKGEMESKNKEDIFVAKSNTCKIKYFKPERLIEIAKMI